MNKGISRFACVALCAASCAGMSANAGETTNELSQAESSAELPSVSAGAFYKSMKIERGMVVNKDSVSGYEAEVEWYGLFLGVEACYDMTNTHGRRGRYNEIAAFAGYGVSLGDFSAHAAYFHKECGGDEPNTQEIGFGLEYETPYATPFIEGSFDVDSNAGALYTAFGLKRDWELAEWATLSACGGIGIGNDRRNRADFDSYKWAFRDMHIGMSMALEVCPHVKIVPFVDLYDQFTSAGRHAYRKGFAAVGGVKLAAEF